MYNIIYTLIYIMYNTLSIHHTIICLYDTNGKFLCNTNGIVLYSQAQQREEALRKSEAMLEQDATRFESFLKMNDQVPSSLLYYSRA